MLDAATRRTPDWLRMNLARAAEIVGRPRVRLGVLTLSLLLATASYVRLMNDIYEGDAWTYWANFHEANPYTTAITHANGPHGYLYSPAFLQFFSPILSLPWEIFYGIWLALLTATLLWLARPWLACLLFPLVFKTFGIALLLVPRHALSSGNIATLMALSIVASFRWPWTYAFLLLTKITPGVGLLWFVVRREWRNLAIALGATAVIALVSFLIAPGLWWDWVNVIRANSTYPEPSFAYHVLPLIPRLIIAALLTIVAARYNARWVMPIVVVISMPYVWDSVLIILVGIAPLVRHDRWTEGHGWRFRRNPTTEVPAAQPA